MRSPHREWGQRPGKSGGVGTRRTHLVLVLGGGVFMIAVIALLTVWAIHQSRSDARRAADITLANLAGTVALNIGNSVHQIDLGLLAILDEVARQQKGAHWDDRAITDAIAREDSRHPDSIGFRVFDADGKLRYGLKNIVNRDVDFSRRDEFKRARDSSGDTLLITPPFIGPVAQQWLIVLVRRITNPDGSFGGAIYAAIPIQQLIQTFATLDLGPDGAVALHHTSTLLAARFPEIKIGTTTISDQLRAIIASGVEEAKFDDVSPADGIHRTGHARKIAKLPYYVSVAIANDHYLMQWRRSVNSILAFSGTAIIIIISVFTFIYLSISSWWRMFDTMTASEQKLRGLFELSPIGIARNSLNGRFIEFNESFRAITGYDSDELRTIDYWKLTPTKYKPDELRQIESLQALGHYGPYEKEYIRKDGALVPLSLRGILVTGPDGGQYIWSLVEDITERKLAQESRAKSEFMAMMSHELRTPLNAILGFSEMIGLSPRSDESFEKNRDYAASITTAGTHLLGIINDILDISAVEAGKLSLRPEEVDLIAVVESAQTLIAPRAAERTLRLDIRMEEVPSIRIRSDSQRIKQILINLLGNAVKFTPEGGWIRLRVSGTGDGGVAFAVSDNGIGMDSEGIAKALSMFGQVDSSLARKYQGTGLGLPLCRKLAEALGGTVEIESEAGKGTTVTVALPSSCDNA